MTDHHRRRSSGHQEPAEILLVLKLSVKLKVLAIPLQDLASVVPSKSAYELRLAGAMMVRPSLWMSTYGPGAASEDVVKVSHDVSTGIGLRSRCTSCG